MPPSTVSLKHRLTLGLSAMLIPLGALIAGICLSLETVTRTFEHVSAETGQEVFALVELRTSIISVSLLANPNLSQAHSTEQQTFAEVSAKLDTLFATNAENSIYHEFDDPEEMELLQAAAVEWRAIREIATPLIEQEVPQEQVSAQFQLLSAHLKRLSAIAEKLLAWAEAEHREDLQEALVVKRTIYQMMAGALLVAIAVTVVVVSGLRRYIFQPLNQFQAAVQQFGTESLDYRVPSNYQGEFGTLATTFNAMAARIEKGHQVLYQMAQRDSLTNLLNRSRFQTYLNLVIAQ